MMIIHFRKINFPLKVSHDFFSSVFIIHHLYCSFAIFYFFSQAQKYGNNYLVKLRSKIIWQVFNMIKYYYSKTEAMCFTVGYFYWHVMIMNLFPQGHYNFQIFLFFSSSSLVNLKTETCQSEKKKNWKFN